MPDNKFRFGQVLKALEAQKHTLPVQIANHAQNYFVGAWKRQAWDGQPWQEVKRRQPGTPEYKYPKTRDLGRHTRAILVGSIYNKKGEHLRNQVSHSIRSATFDIIRLVVESPYAARHNEGLDGMPRRTFMGQTVELTRMQREMITKSIDSIFK